MDAVTGVSGSGPAYAFLHRGPADAGSRTVCPATRRWPWRYDPAGFGNWCRRAAIIRRTARPSPRRAEHHLGAAYPGERPIPRFDHECGGCSSETFQGSGDIKLLETQKPKAGAGGMKKPETSGFRLSYPFVQPICSRTVAGGSGSLRQRRRRSSEHLAKRRSGQGCFFGRSCRSMATFL